MSDTNKAKAVSVQDRQKFCDRLQAITQKNTSKTKPTPTRSVVLTHSKERAKEYLKNAKAGVTGKLHTDDQMIGSVNLLPGIGWRTQEGAYEAITAVRACGGTSVYAIAFGGANLQPPAARGRKAGFDWRSAAANLETLDDDMLDADDIADDIDADDIDAEEDDSEDTED